MTYAKKTDTPRISVLLRDAVEKSGISLTRLAKECGITRQSVNGWMKTGNIDKEHFPTIHRVTGLSLEALVSGGEIDTSGIVAISGDKITVPLVAKGSMGKGILLPANYEGSFSSVTFDVSWAKKNLPSYTSLENLRLMVGLGDSMEGTYNDGDMLIVDIGVHEIKLDAVYALSKEGELFIKRYQRLPDGSIMMISDNTKYRPIPIPKKDLHEFKVEARVLMALQSIRL